MDASAIVAVEPGTVGSTVMARSLKAQVSDAPEVAREGVAAALPEGVRTDLNSMYR